MTGLDRRAALRDPWGAASEVADERERRHEPLRRRSNRVVVAALVVVVVVLSSLWWLPRAGFLVHRREVTVRVVCSGALSAGGWNRPDDPALASALHFGPNRTEALALRGELGWSGPLAPILRLHLPDGTTRRLSLHHQRPGLQQVGCDYG